MTYISMKSVSRYIRCFYFAFSTISRIYTDVEGTPEGSGTCAAGPNVSHQYGAVISK